MTEQATPKQIEAIQKLKLHATPWTLSKKEAWTIMDDHFKGKEKFEKEVTASEYPVVRPGFTPKVEEKKPVKEFHLSPEQVNTNALNAAIEAIKAGFNAQVLTDLPEIAQKFKEFIENGN